MSQKKWLFYNKIVNSKIEKIIYKRSVKCRFVLRDAERLYFKNKVLFPWKSRYHKGLLYSIKKTTWGSKNKKLRNLKKQLIKRHRLEKYIRTIFIIIYLKKIALSYLKYQILKKTR